ncbi:hypothetical protein [Georgenia muralis]|uniref:Uncharacterized protein n=1 Tax=Georgenia muralis TaxID=154117 RepID=A0A3N4ZA31_9MICO|nr:hypothetical protein [Georgenia muralis]RPF28973.1 hypothetical protein EDD32_3524 [Georgenia muralis]
MTDLTTIKVTKAVRDRLKRQADEAHLSLGAHLARLADSADRQARFSALREAADRSPLDQAELEAWDVVEWDDPRER